MHLSVSSVCCCCVFRFKILSTSVFGFYLVVCVLKTQHGAILMSATVTVIALHLGCRFLQQLPFYELQDRESKTRIT